MRKEDKQIIIEGLTDHINTSKHFYLTDISGMNAEKTSSLRRKCFEKDIKLVVVKNTLFRKALEAAEGTYDEIFDSLKESTSVMFCETGNVPAKLIKEIRKSGDKPKLKAAFVEESVYIGDDQLNALSSIKSKEELIADVIALLQSPVKNVMSQLNSGANILHGVLDTLKEKNN